MKILWSAAGLIAVVGVSSVAILSALAWSRPLGPEMTPGLAAPVSIPVPNEQMPDTSVRRGALQAAAGSVPPARKEITSRIQPPLPPPWTATVAAGDTLDFLLQQAGLEAAIRAEIALAIAAEFNFAHLRPGHRLSVKSSSEGALVSLELEIDEGVRILARIADEVDVRKLAPEARRISRVREVTVEGSIFASLKAEDVPPRFAVDLAQMLAGTVDFRRDMRGGETLRLLWEEKRRKDGTRLGQPQLTYADIGIGEARFEIVWPDEGGEVANIYMDGEVVRTFAPPVVGARLTSSFGKRRHPVYGDTRMHTGVDFAAPRATPVFATAPGRVAFVGRRSGYGRIVEIIHGSGTMTRYAHLSAFADGAEVGDRINAGDRIGAVGSSGLATGPNLHYEVRLDGRPVDPMDHDRWVELAGDPAETGAEQQLIDARASLTALLDGDQTADRQSAPAGKEGTS